MSEDFFSLIHLFGYVGVFGLTLLEYVFPFTPAHLVVPFAGFLVGQGELSFVGVWLSATFGGLSGSLVLYALGRLGDEARLRTFILRHERWLTVTPAEWERAVNKFNRYGLLALFLLHLFPLVSPLRVAFSILAGVHRLSALKVSLITLIGNLGWMGLQVLVASLLGENWRFLKPYEDLALWALLAFFVLMLVWYVVRLFRRRQSHKKQASTSS
jgi:membrane protein DedA with SNARE-associated domain